MLLRYQIAPYVVLQQRYTGQECRTDSDVYVVLIQKEFVPISGECRQEMLTGLLQTIGLLGESS